MVENVFELCAHVGSIPSSSPQTVTFGCFSAWQDFYQALYTQSQAQFDTYVGSGTILNNYAHIFDVSCQSSCKALTDLTAVAIEIVSGRRMFVLCDRFRSR